MYIPNYSFAFDPKNIINWSTIQLAKNYNIENQKVLRKMKKKKSKILYW